MWFVDLVPVTDPSMIASVIAAALGLGEHQGRSAEDTVVGWLAVRETLLVLDNCEHLLDGVVALLERLLAASSGLSVLVTSRARLLVPFEWVFPVPGLSLEADGGGPGDAAELFLERAAAAGSRLTSDDGTASPQSVGGSTAWRWQSSWPPRVSRRLVWMGSRRGSRTGCGY